MAENNNIPKHWKVKKLGEECICVTGTTPPKNDSKNYGNDIPFVKPPQLFDKSINDAPEKLSNKGADLARVLPINSVLVTCIGNLGRTAINKIPVAFNQQINAIIPSENVDGRFLFYQAQSPEFRKQLEDLSAATTVAIVNKGKFETIKIILPPLPEQQVIVSKIEELLSDLENGKQQLQTAQQQLKVYRQSLLKWAFEGKLTRLNYDPPDLHDEHDLNMAAESQIEYIKNQGSDNLPKGWKWVKLKDIATDISDGDHQAPPKASRGIPFITISNVNKLNNKIVFANTFKVHSDYYLSLKANRKPKKGDVLYTVTGSFGIPIIIDFEKDFCFQRHIGLIRPLPKINQKWIYYLLQSPQLFKQAKDTATGTAQKTVALNSLRNFSIPLCSAEEQQLIVEELESKLTVCDKIEETISHSLQQAETLWQSILKKAFEGRLVNEK